MSSSGFGVFLAVIFLAAASIWTSPDKPLRYLDAHGSFIVFVGTAVIGVLAVPWESIRRFFQMIKVVCVKSVDDSAQIVNTLVEMADKARGDMEALKEYLNKTTDLFLKDAILILLDGFETKDVEHILRRRIEVQKERESTDAKMFKNLGKYPPATGLIGTVMGMIALLASLGQEGAEDKIGPAMSVAMAATLYGVILANLIILPVADNLIFLSQKSIAKREMILEGILLIKQGTSPVMVREILLSHLSPTLRGGVKGKGSSSTQEAKAA